MLECSKLRISLLLCKISSVRLGAIAGVEAGWESTLRHVGRIV